MALSSTALQADIKTALKALNANTKDTEADAFAGAIATAVINHIKGFAVVTSTVPVLAVATTGSATSQSGATAPGVATGTIS